MGSLHILEGYKDGGDILGRPVRIRRVDMGDRENNWTDGLNARVRISQYTNVISVNSS